MTEKEFKELKRLESKGYFTCFRTGVWKDFEGELHDITQGDLETIANQFTEITRKGQEVPIFIEHPKRGGVPEQGKIQSVIWFGDYLLAKAKEVKTELIDKIKKGLYKFVSIAMNPKFELQHIGVTNQPAVDGLMPIKEAFSSFSKGNIVYHFETSKLFSKRGKGLNEIKDWLKKFETWAEDFFTPETPEDIPVMKEVANQFTKNINQSKKEEPMKDEEGTKVPDKEKGDQKDQTAEFQKKLAEYEKAKIDAEAKAKAALQKVADIEEQNRKTTIATFTGKLLEEGKLYPNEVEPMTEFLLKQDNQQTFKFSKDAEKEETSLQFIQTFLEEIPKRLPLDKIQGTKTKTGQDNACFSRIKPDDENLDLHYQAKALMAKEEIYYEEALSRLEDV